MRRTCSPRVPQTHCSVQGTHPCVCCVLSIRCRGGALAGLMVQLPRPPAPKGRVLPQRPRVSGGRPTLQGGALAGLMVQLPRPPAPTGRVLPQRPRMSGGRPTPQGGGARRVGAPLQGPRASGKPRIGRRLHQRPRVIGKPPVGGTKLRSTRRGPRSGTRFQRPGRRSGTRFQRPGRPRFRSGLGRRRFRKRGRHRFRQRAP